MTAELELAESDAFGRDSGAGGPGVEATIEEILARTFPAVGEEFLRRLVGVLASALPARGALLTTESPSTSLVAFWLARDYGVRIESGVWGPRPVEFTRPDGSGFDRVVRRLLTGDGHLARLDVRSCHGIGVYDAADRVIGHLVAIEPAHGTAPGFVTAVLAGLAARVLGELPAQCGPNTSTAAVGVTRRGARALVTACAWCGRVRDENRQWQAIDDDYTRRMSVDFTHGICPDCVRRHHP